MQPLVLITGASSGIGLSLAEVFAGKGWRLALVARRSSEIRQHMSALGVALEQFQVFQADVCDHAAMQAMGRECLSQMGVPDVVIANAGISLGVDLSDPEDLSVMARILDTNVMGVAATFAPFIEPMRARGHGKLVGISSVAGIRGLPGHGAYCASKAAVISLCESLRAELRGSGVRVQTICPGYIATPLTQNNRYKMPFLMPSQDFAARAYGVVMSAASYRVIPWQMSLVAKLLRALPNSWFDAIFAKRARKARLKH